MCHKRKTSWQKANNNRTSEYQNDERREKWYQPTQKLSFTKEKKKLLAKAIERVLRLILQNYFYTFNSQNKKQKEGRPIELVITCHSIVGNTNVKKICR